MRRWAAAVALAGLGLAGGARAEDAPRVVVAGAGATFAHAADVALGPWRVRVVEVDGPAPHGKDEARALGARHGAAVVAWFEGARGDATLHVYDTQTGETTTRTVAEGPPFDEVAAAAAALSLKTLLRSSKIAPEAERAPDPTPPPPPPAEVPPTPPPAPARPPVDEAAPSDRLELAIGGGARTLAGAVEPRGAIALRGWVARGAALGGAVGVRLGPGRSVEGALDGRLSAFTASAAGAYRLPIGAWSVAPGLGASLHATRIEGVTSPRATRVSEGRADLSIDAAIAVERRLGARFGVGASAGGSYLVRNQRYLVAGEPVLEVAPVQGFVELHVVLGVL